MIHRAKRLIAASLAATLILAASLAGSATAITDGYPDEDGHPYVGLMVAKNAAGAPLWRCSGTLLSSTVFLTAGHCTDGAADIEIWFDDGYPSPIPLGAGYPAAGSNPCAGVSGYPCIGDASGTPYVHPSYTSSAFFRYDLGVVVLDSPEIKSSYGVLPILNQLDALKPGRNTRFTAVGYGLQKAFPTATDWKESRLRTRIVANPYLVQINVPGFTGDFSLLLSNNAYSGGTCFGDSGGPNFLGTSNVVAGVTSFGLNSTCAGTGGVYRVDRADDLNWLATFFD